MLRRLFYIIGITQLVLAAAWFAVSANMPGVVVSFSAACFWSWLDEVVSMKDGE